MQNLCSIFFGKVYMKTLTNKHMFAIMIIQTNVRDSYLHQLRNITLFLMEGLL